MKLVWVKKKERETQLNCSFLLASDLWNAGSTWDRGQQLPWWASGRSSSAQVHSPESPLGPHIALRGFILLSQQLQKFQAGACWSTQTWDLLTVSSVSKREAPRKTLSFTEILKVCYTPMDTENSAQSPAMALVILETPFLRWWKIKEYIGICDPINDTSA